MKREAIGEIRPIDIAATLNDIAIRLEELNALLQLYDEHQGDELAGVNPQKPYTVTVLINRQELGLALLRAIEDKANLLQELATSTMKKAYKLAHSPKGLTVESEG